MAGMSRRPARCTEADLKRAVKIAGQSPTRMKVLVRPDGVIEIAPVTEGTPEQPTRPKKRIVL